MINEAYDPVFQGFDIYNSKVYAEHFKKPFFHNHAFCGWIKTYNTRFCLHENEFEIKKEYFPNDITFHIHFMGGDRADFW